MKAPQQDSVSTVVATIAERAAQGLSDATWLGSLSMAMAIAERALADGDLEHARRALRHVLDAYMADPGCPDELAALLWDERAAPVPLTSQIAGLLDRGGHQLRPGERMTPDGHRYSAEWL